MEKSLIIAMLLFASCQAINHVTNDVAEHGKNGTIETCEGDHTLLNATFSPFVYTRNTKIVSFRYSLILKRELSAGTARVQMLVPGIPDPVYRAEYTYDCDTIHKGAHISCPVPAGKLITGQFQQEIRYSSHMDTLPPGIYTWSVDVQDEGGQRVSCIQASFFLDNRPMSNGIEQVPSWKANHIRKPYYA